MDEKYNTLSDLMNSSFIFDKYKDYNKYKDYDWDQYKQSPYIASPYTKKEPTKFDLSEYEKLIQKFMEKPVDPEIAWREALEKMPIGFIEKFLRKKKLANIKPEE